MSVVAIYRGGEKHTLEPIAPVLARATRRCRSSSATGPRLDAVSSSLSALEVEDLVTLRDVASVLQRAEMVRRIAEEIEGYVVDLGADGRLVLLQLEELMGGVADDRRLVVKDYFQPSSGYELDDALRLLSTLSTEQLLDLHETSAVLHLGADVNSDTPLQPRGYRLLLKIPRLPEVVAERVVERFSGPEQDPAGGGRRPGAGRRIGEARARAIKDNLSRLAETSILERYE